MTERPSETYFGALPVDRAALDRAVEKPRGKVVFGKGARTEKDRAEEWRLSGERCLWNGRSFVRLRSVKRRGRETVLEVV